MARYVVKVRRYETVCSVVEVVIEAKGKRLAREKALAIAALAVNQEDIWKLEDAGTPDKFDVVSCENVEEL